MVAQGLFHRAIMASGSALTPWSMATDAVGYSRKLAAKVGCPDDPDKNAIMVNCLRQKQASELVNIEVESPRFLTNIGPTIDGIVIPNDPSILMESINSIFTSYDLLIGLSKVGYYEFTAQDEKIGIESSRWDKIIRTLVRNLYNYHLQEIALTISNEYTDWSKSPSKINSMDVLERLTELLSDAMSVAPSIKSALMHSKSRKVTYLYEFAYGSERGDHPPHLGCVHGDELAYMFGAPLVPGMSLGYFTNVYSRQETSLAELFMTYLGDFVRNGNPNSDATVSVPSQASSLPGATGESSKNDRIERVPWPPFDDKQQLYLSMSLKPKVKDHYHAHRLSYWNNLIPKLHVPGSSGSGVEHHLLADHDDVNSYEGKLRDSSVSRMKALMDSTSGETSVADTSVIGGNITFSNNSTSLLSSSSNVHPSSKVIPSIALSGVTSKSSLGNLDASKLHPLNSVKSASDHSKILTAGNNHFNGDDASSKSINASSVSMMFQEGSYSTALSVTIGVGTSLLIINVLIFLGTFYQRDRVNATNSSACVSSSTCSATSNNCHSNSTLSRSNQQQQQQQAQLQLQSQQQQQSGKQVNDVDDSLHKLSINDHSHHHHHHHHNNTLGRLSHSGHHAISSNGQLHHHHPHDSGSLMNTFNPNNRNIYPGDPTLSVPIGESLSPCISPSHTGGGGGGGGQGSDSHHHHHHHHSQPTSDYGNSYSTHVSMVNSSSFYTTAATLLPSGTTGSTLAVTTLPSMTEDTLLTDGNNSKQLDPKLLGNTELLATSYDYDQDSLQQQQQLMQHSSHHLHQPLLIQRNSDHHINNMMNI